MPAKFAGAANNVGTYEGMYVAGSGDLIGDAATTLAAPTNWIGVHSARVPSEVTGTRLAGLFLNTVRVRQAATADTALEGMVDGDASPRWKITAGGGLQSPDTDRIFVSITELMLTQGVPQTSNVGGVPCYYFDAVTDERISGQVALPSHWAAFAVDLHRTQNAVGAGDVRWRWEEKFVVNGDTLALSPSPRSSAPHQRAQSSWSQTW